jgi:O-antigen/teichoic acid export membrane protein
VAAIVSTVLTRHIFFREATEAAPRWPLLSGFFFSLGSASKTAYSDLDKVMLLHFSGPADNGIYTAAYRIINLAATPIRAIVLGSNTRFFRAGASGPSAAYAMAVRLTPGICLYGVVMGGLLFGLAPLVPVLLGADYAEAADALRWLSLLPLVSSVHYLFGDALMGSGRQQTRSMLQLLTVALNGGLNLFLIPAFGWRGAAVATLTAEAVLAVTIVIALRFHSAQQVIQRDDDAFQES